MKFDDIFREQIARYNFAKKFVGNNVLDISYGSYLSFYGAKKLLDEGEEFNFDNFSKKRGMYPESHTGVVC